MLLSSGCIFNMAPGLSGRFPGLSLVAFSALGFIGFFTFVGFIYERFKKIEYKDGQKSKKSAPQAKQKDSKVQQDARDVQVNSQGELTDSQIKHLINVIGTVDEATLENLLISLANWCAFTKNQNIIRENGGLPVLMELLHHSNGKIRSRAVQTLSNLAMNTENQKQISVCLPVLQEEINPTHLSNKTEDDIVAVLQLLVNMSVVDTWHADMKQCIYYCFDILHQEPLSDKLKVNTLRLLVNLSCNKENVEHFLTEKIMVLARFMDPTIDEGIVLRTIVIQLNVLQNIANDPALKETAKNIAEGVEDKLDVLETSRNEEIAAKATKIKKLLNNL